MSEGLRGVSGSMFLPISLNFRKPQIIFLTDVEVSDVSNIKMSQSYGRFDILGSLRRGF